MYKNTPKINGQPKSQTFSLKLFCHYAHGQADETVWCYGSGSQPFETRGPLCKFCLGSRTTEAGRATVFQFTQQNLFLNLSTQISNFPITFFEVNFTKDLHPSNSSEISENLRRNRKNSQPADHQAGRLSPQIENRCATDVCHPRSHLHNC